MGKTERKQRKTEEQLLRRDYKETLLLTDMKSKLQSI